MSVEDVVAVLTHAKARLVVLLCHQNADPDALGSLYALTHLLQRIQPHLHLEAAAPQGVSKLSSEILEVIPLDLTPTPRIEAADVIFLVDTSTIEQLGPWKARVEQTTKPIVVIDHHVAHPATTKLAHLAVIQETASSTCEIVYKLFRQQGLSPAPKTAEALFLGIAFDTQHFRIATAATFKAVAELIDCGVEPTKLVPLLMTPMDHSERVSRLKAAKRLTLMKVEEWLVAVSHVSSYQSSAARALLSVGAHVVVVCGKKGETLRISLRSTREFYRKTGIHLGRDIAKPLGDYVQGMGGGHSTAAGVNGRGEVRAASMRCIALLREHLTRGESNQL